MLNFRILQKICQNYNEKLLFGNLEQLKQVNTKLDKQMFIEFQEFRNQKQLNSIPIQSEKYQELEKKRLIFKYYSKYANAGYGNSISSGKGIHKTIRIQNQTEEFIQHIGIDRKNLLFQQWKTQPNKPAYCICADEQNKSIVVTVRGSSDINDAITDLTCSLIDFSIIEDSQTQFVKYLKINKNVYHTQDFQGNDSTKSFNLIDPKLETNKVQEDLIQDENEISGTNFQEKEDFPINTQKEIIRGYAHSGILLASINLFKEIVPKLNQIFEQYSPYEYDLVVTGHSLGGGITTCLSLLFEIHPLKAFLLLKKQNQELNLSKKYKFISFAGPPVFSKSINQILNQIEFYSIIHNTDCVTRLSFNSVKNILQSIIMLHNLNQKDRLILKKLRNFKQKDDFQNYSSQEIQQVQQFVEIYKKLRQTSFELEFQEPQLVQTGKVYLIQEYIQNIQSSQKINPFTLKKKEKIKENLLYIFSEIKEPENYFKQIIFSRNMIQYHYPNLYENGLKSNNVIYTIQ